VILHCLQQNMQKLRRALHRKKHRNSRGVAQSGQNSDGSLSSLATLPDPTQGSQGQGNQGSIISPEDSHVNSSRQPAPNQGHQNPENSTQPADAVEGIKQPVQNSDGSISNLTTLPDPAQGTQENQGPVISPEDSLSETSQQLAPNQGSQNPANSTQSGTEAAEEPVNAWHVAGAVFEKTLKAFKSFADLIPAAPGLGPALEVVCGCIEVYHVSNI
jgi:hypothetical protein